MFHSNLILFNSCDTWKVILLAFHHYTFLLLFISFDFNPTQYLCSHRRVYIVRIPSLYKHLWALYPFLWLFLCRKTFFSNTVHQGTMYWIVYVKLANWNLFSSWCMFFRTHCSLQPVFCPYLYTTWHCSK